MLLTYPPPLDIRDLNLDFTDRLLHENSEDKGKHFTLCGPDNDLIKKKSLSRCGFYNPQRCPFADLCQGQAHPSKFPHMQLNS